MVDNVRGGISECIGRTKENKGVQTFKILQKTETVILFIYSPLWPTFSFYNNLCPRTRIFPEKNVCSQVGPKFGRNLANLKFLPNSKCPKWPIFFLTKSELGDKIVIETKTWPEMRVYINKN